MEYDKAIAWFHDHPRALRALTTGLVIFGVINLNRAIRLDAKAAEYIRTIKGEAQKAVSEGLGG